MGYEHTPDGHGEAADTRNGAVLLRLTRLTCRKRARDPTPPSIIVTVARWAGRIAQTAGEKNRDPKARTSLGDDRPLQLGKHTHCYCRPNKKAWKKMEEHAGIFGPDRWAATERSGGNLVTFLPIAIER
jgi:hypothetical protein